MNGFEEGLSDAQAALKALQPEAEEAARGIDEAFARAGRSVAASLAKAASDGKVSLKELASALIAAVNAAAGSSSGGGLGSVLEQAVSAFSGARAGGGPVTPGGAYLVGERGPELFRPSQSGVIETGSGQTVQVNLTVTGGSEGLARSEAQIASALSRAARMGLR